MVVTVATVMMELWFTLIWFLGLNNSYSCGSKSQ
jgi:hypothetical protein